MIGKYLGGAISTGTATGALGMLLSKHFLKGFKSVPGFIANQGQAEKAIGIVSGSYGALQSPTLVSVIEERKKLKQLKNKGIIIKGNKIIKMTPDAINKYLTKESSYSSFISPMGSSFVAPIIGGLVGSALPAESTEKRLRNTAIGWGTGTVVGTGMLAKNLSKTLKNKSKNFYKNRASGGTARRGGPTIEQAADNLGIKFKEGKFYDEAGNVIKTKKDITKKYRTNAMKFHPDRGGNIDTFKKVNTSFNNVIKKSPYFNKLAKMQDSTKGALAGLTIGTAYDIGVNGLKGRALKGHPITIGIVTGFAAGLGKQLYENYAKRNKQKSSIK